MKNECIKYVPEVKERLIYYVIAYTASGALLYLFYKNIGVSVIFGTLGGFTEKYYCEYKLKRQMERITLQFRDLLYSIGSSISAGRYLQEALEEGEVALKVIYGEKSLLADELESINRNIRTSRIDSKDALMELAERSGSDDIRNFAEVCGICRETGGDMQKVISEAAANIADKMRVKKEIRTLMAQKRFEARIVSLMPIAVITMLNLISPDYLQPLYGGIQGRLIMTAALAGFVVSCLWMFRLTEVESI